MIQPINALKSMADSFGIAKKNLIVLAPKNDPFNSGTKTDRIQAEWFAKVMKDLGLPPGKHLRRYFYLLVTQDQPVVMPTGSKFENLESHWAYLQNASRHARYMGLIDPNQFTDNRNPSAVEFHAAPREEPNPSWRIDDFCDWTLPRISMVPGGGLYLPDIFVEGYDYDDGDQSYHLECWIEKSTMDEELDPICEQYRVTKKQGIGFDSVTSVVKLLERCQKFMEMDRPIRIFYISDFDPAGDAMPRAIARQLQFWLWRFGCEADIRLKPLVLTQSQVDEYNLPRKPIKDEDRRKANFEKRHGEGHVELDALAALHPGEFERIVSEAFSDYRDESLQEELDEAFDDATHEAESAWEQATAHVQEWVDNLREKVQAVSDKYQPEVDALRERLAVELAPLKVAMDELHKQALEECEEERRLLQVHLPLRPSAAPEAEAEGEEWLFDSSRSFGQQLEYFHAHRNGELA